MVVITEVVATVVQSRSRNSFLCFLFFVTIEVVVVYDIVFVEIVVVIVIDSIFVLQNHCSV